VLLTHLGWNPFFENHFQKSKAQAGRVPARVCEESRGVLRVLMGTAECFARVAGKVRHAAQERAELPVVGDWVVVVPPSSRGEEALIEAILPRQTALRRREAGRVAGEQILAANIDFVFIVTSLNREWNARRLERYMSLAWESGARPVVLLTKADLLPDGSIPEECERLTLGAPVHRVSVFTGEGLAAVSEMIETGRTAVLIGSSGVGKSTLINALAGSDLQRVQGVRAWDDRGRHTTSARQLVLLQSGGMMIDTPGLRKLGLWESDCGLRQAFADVGELSAGCRFHDCTHRNEPGCAVRQAADDGYLTRERLDNYRKLQAELNYLRTRTDWQAAKSARSRAKRMCKAIKRLPRKGW
jgi:ribosome biogenesis GTPase